MVTLWKDHGQISLASHVVWGAGATLTVPSAAWWADIFFLLGLDLSNGAVLQALAAVASRSVQCGRRSVSLRRSQRAAVGVAMGADRAVLCC